jgi:hypothetical protein
MLPSQLGNNPPGFENVWSNPEVDPALKPPKPNSLAEVPFNRLIHHIDYLEKLDECVVVDRGVIKLIHNKMASVDSTDRSRQLVTIYLLDDLGDVIAVKIWIIPIFSNGVLVYLLFAADDENLEYLNRIRNPAKPGTYDITSF